VLVLVGIIVILLLITFMGTPSSPPTLSNVSKDASLVNEINEAVINYQIEYEQPPIPYGVERGSGYVCLGSPKGSPFTTVLPGTELLFQGLNGNVNAFTGVSTDFSKTAVWCNNGERFDRPNTRWSTSY
jgi:hypothetical protein